MNLFEYVGSQIRQLRIGYAGGKGISQEALGKELKVAANTISRWETSTYQPTLEDLDRLARFFGVSVLRFFPDDTEGEARVEALLRAAQDLDDDDLEELQRYAEYRRARHVMKRHKAPARGRRSKKPA